MKSTWFRTLILFAMFAVCAPSWAADKLVIKADEDEAVISKYLYGQFAEHLGHCIYGGLWVGEDSSIPNTRGIRDDVVTALKKLNIPVLRWPGGCFADEYHWRDGIGPRDQRPPMVNSHWGMVTEDNSFGTHEFLDLCEMLGCDPYISGNVGSGTVREMQQWVEYITHEAGGPMSNLRKENGREKPWKLPFFGVGNENWGCGGNMTPEFYADQYKRFATYVRNYSGNRVYKIACGANSFDYNWTEVLMREARRQMNGLSLHYYCGSGNDSRSATQFEEDDWFAQLKRALDLDTLITHQSAIMDKYDREKRVGLILDEWGAWHAVEPGTNPGFLFQQNSLRDALVAGLSLNIINQHAERVRMANIAQMVNVLQAMVLTQDEKMLVTPTYHVYEMYKVHQDAVLVPAELICRKYQYKDDSIPAANVSASKAKDGSLNITLCNLDPNQPIEMECEVRGFKTGSVSARVLTAGDITAHNTFDQPQAVEPAPFKDFKKTNDGLTLTLPSKSVVAIHITR
ncbi:MAG: alpha-N-arabinofuranosidase [bacterium]|nr:alpha-N-arabinofuranosidase [bacterium]